MGRTVKDFVFNQYPQGLANMVHEYLISEGYKLKERKGEQVYQKGVGLAMGPTFIKLTLINNGARLEGWQMSAILPGVYAGEIDIDSFVGVAVKGPLKERFRTIEEMIMRFGGAPVFPGAMPGQVNPPMQAGYQQPCGYPPVQGGYQQPQMQGYYQQPPMPQAVPYQPQSQPIQHRPQQAGKFCQVCGAAIENGMKFCMSCGNKLG